ECLKIRQELARIDPRDTQSGVELALAFARCGMDSDAEKLAASLLKQAANDRQVLFQVACALSVVSGTTADKGTAERCRNQAFQAPRARGKAGWRARGGIEAARDFGAARDAPRLKELREPWPKPAAEARPPAGGNVEIAGMAPQTPASWKEEPP